MGRSAGLRELPEQQCPRRKAARSDRNRIAGRECGRSRGISAAELDTLSVGAADYDITGESSSVGIPADIDDIIAGGGIVESRQAAENVARAVIGYVEVGAAGVIESGGVVELIGVAVAQHEVTGPRIGKCSRTIEDIITCAGVVGSACLSDGEALLEGGISQRDCRGRDIDGTVDRDRAVESGGGSSGDGKGTVLHRSACKGCRGPADGQRSRAEIQRTAGQRKIIDRGTGIEDAGVTTGDDGNIIGSAGHAARRPVSGCVPRRGDGTVPGIGGLAFYG